MHGACCYSRDSALQFELELFEHSSSNFATDSDSCKFAPTSLSKLNRLHASTEFVSIIIYLIYSSIFNLVYIFKSSHFISFHISWISSLIMSWLLSNGLSLHSLKATGQMTPQFARPPTMSESLKLTEKMDKKSEKSGNKSRHQRP